MILCQYQTFRARCTSVNVCVNRNSMSAAALRANVGLMCGIVSPEAFLGQLCLPKKTASVSNAFSAWRAHEYSKSIQRIAIMRNCSSVGEKVRHAKRHSLCNGTCRACLGLAQFIDCCKKSTVASSLAALSSHNRPHSYGPFYLARGDKWT